MDYHQNARLTIHSRVQLAKMALERGATLRAAAAAFKVSPKTAAKWVCRYRERGLDGLKDLSSKPHRSPRQPPSVFLERVLVLRRQRRNYWQIARELHLSRATVSRILRCSGLNRLRSLDPPPPIVRYEGKHPDDLIHFDIKRLARIHKPGHRVTRNRRNQSRSVGSEYLHVIIDDHSRIAFSALLPDQSHRSAMGFLKRIDLSADVRAACLVFQNASSSGWYQAMVS
ncbi:MAG: leucine zipper domain-containing protein [Acidobacteriaceae bacterium]